MPSKLTRKILPRAPFTCLHLFAKDWSILNLSIILLACCNFSRCLNFRGSTIWILLLLDAPIEVDAWNDRQLTRFYAKAMFGLIFVKKQVCAPCFHSRLDQLLGCVSMMSICFHSKECWRSCGFGLCVSMILNLRKLDFLAQAINNSFHSVLKL